MLDIPCVIFAGGKSSRMGEDKALLPFSSFQTLTEFQLSRLSKIFSNVYISCKSRDKFDFDANFIEDIQTENLFAPTAGFLAIFKTLQTERVFVLSVDTPFVKKDEIMQILEHDRENVDATIARIDAGIQPMCGIYHKSLESKFQNMLERDSHKLGYLLKNSQTNYVDFQEKKTFLNMNHPHECKEALNLL